MRQLAGTAKRATIRHGRPHLATLPIAIADLRPIRRYFTVCPQAPILPRRWRTFTYDTEVGEHGGQLAGGQQRRIAVARALLRDAPLLLPDEPTTGLDPVAEANVITGLLEATAGKTVLLVTHQPRLGGLADQVARLDAGRITVSDCHAVAASMSRVSAAGLTAGERFDVLDVHNQWVTTGIER